MSYSNLAKRPVMLKTVIKTYFNGNQVRGFQTESRLSPLANFVGDARLPLGSVVRKKV